MVGIVFIQDIRYCPYMERYAELFEKHGLQYECIWWERWRHPPTTPLPPYVEQAEDRHVFFKPSEMTRNPFWKVADFYAFSRFARDIILKRRYDRLLILTTMSGVLLFDLLLGQYRGRYVFDIRDFSYENLRPFRWLEGRLIDRSFFTCISSQGFLEFLPRGRNYLAADNFMHSDLQVASGAYFRKKAPGEPIVVSFLGFIRYFEENHLIIDRLLADARFVVRYHGIGADYGKLLAYSDGLDGPRRQRFQVTGYYDQIEDRPALYRQADIINNYYTPRIETMRLATTNKVYDAMIFRRPQLVAPGTHVEKLVTRWQVGCALDAERSDFADRLYAYYHALNEEPFNRAAQLAMDEVLVRDRKYMERIEDFCRMRTDADWKGDVE